MTSYRHPRADYLSCALVSTMAVKKGVMGFVSAAILVHAIMLISLIDLYTIPYEDGAKTPQFYPLQPPAKRLVVFVADGALADSVFSVTEDGVSHAPFLRGVATKGGRWGVSHGIGDYQTLYTGVPYERGGLWRRTGQYDSLFAASVDTWYWSVAQQPHSAAIHLNSAHKIESGTTVSQIVSSVESFFDLNNTTQVQLITSREKLIFLIEFPASSQESLQLIDSALEKVTNLVNTFCDDKGTSFIFTSAIDDELSSSTLHLQARQTVQLPFISWGAGIKKARSSQKADRHYNDGLADKWQLAKHERLDIQQEDSAALMATIIGVHVPVDSEGVLPAGYIHYNKAFDASSLFANARQLLELARAKEDWIKSHSLPFLFRPFPELARSAQTEAIDEMIKQRKLQEGIHFSKQLVAQCKQALSYYQSYHQTSLKLLLLIGFVGWIMCTVAILIQNVSHHGHKPTHHTLFVSPSGILLCCVVCLLQLYQRAPLLHYVFACFPVVCWDYVFTHKTIFFCSLNTAARDPSHLLKSLCSIIFLVSCAMLVALNIYFSWMLSGALLIISLLPYVAIQKTEWRLCLSWTASCICLAVIPLLPETYNTIVALISLLLIAAICLVLFSNPQSRHLITTPRSSLAPCNGFFLFVFQVVMLCFCAWTNPRLTTQECSQHIAIPWWSVIMLSVLPVMIGSCSIIGRLLHVFLSLGTLLSAFGSSYGLLSFSVLGVTLFSWLRIEELATDDQKVVSAWHGILCVKKTTVATLVPGEDRVVKTGLPSDEMRRIGFLVLVGGYSFFTYFHSQCFSLPDDNNWLTGGIILASLPLMAVISVYNVILCILDQSYKTSALLYLAALDIIGLTFYILIHDQGDWQETVTQLSMYVCAVGVMLWSCLLFIISCLLTGRSVVPRKLEEHSL